MRHVFYGYILIIFQIHSSILDVLLRVWMNFFFSLQSTCILVGKSEQAHGRVGLALSQEVWVGGTPLTIVALVNHVGQATGTWAKEMATQTL